MSMSPDRVKFRFTDKQDQRQINLRAAERAFGLSTCQAEDIFRRGGEIICRPSQFARFLIYRTEEGATCSRFAILEAQLIGPEAKITDVSMNPREFAR